MLINIFNDVVISALWQFIGGFNRYTSIGNTTEDTSDIVITFCFKDFYAPTVVNAYYICRGMLL